MKILLIIVFAVIMISALVVLIFGYHLLKGVSPESVNIFKSSKEDEFPNEQPKM